MKYPVTKSGSLVVSAMGAIGGSILYSSTRPLKLLKARFIF